ncbi:MAG TPA: hypothetical protein VNK43_05010 [Gemmatimonadales bacterium]|nr:hypothetical protein [Gemmatimonadales bacterium]
MPVLVTCQCGKSYDLKEEFAGRMVRCPHCGAVSQAGAGRPADALADPVLDRDVFLLRQEHLAIDEKYHVRDEQGRTLFYVERPRHLLRNLAALLAGLMVGGVALGLLGWLLEATRELPMLQLVLLPAGVGGTLVTIGVVAAALSRKRHVTFYRGGPEGEPLLDVLQNEKVFFVNASYTVRDPDGRPLALLRKNYLYNLVRKRWWCYAPDGRLLCEAKEDSVILSLLRRFLGTFFGLLRTNFLIVDPGRDEVLGELKRKVTILDRYVLDLRPDRARRLDRRVALALGVMLDTGERR